ncbi:MAG: cation:proton antiporter [Candidatus Eisenbacteria bacterium]|nr:cation:proton antiporter [Candidatus Eisenbacteria bacterium]
MHDAPDFLRTLAVVLGVAAVTTVVFQRLRQPVVFGYMLAGLIVGPHVPIPLVADSATVHTLSELGIILLMFALGLEFSLRRLVGAGWPVLIVAVLQSTLMLGLGYTAGRLFGWSVLQSIFAGAVIAVSSTTIIIKAFLDQKVQGRVVDLVFGVLIVEDVLSILMLAILVPLSAGGPAAIPVSETLVRLGAFLAGVLLIGMLVVPRLMRFVARMKRPETTLVASIGICFAIALLARSFGYSVALGAFIAGSLVEESGEGKVVSHLVEPVRDMFAAVFFVSVGMLIEPRLVAEHWVAVAIFTLLVVVGKVGAVSVSAFLTGAGIRTALQAGMSLAQIGEFSFILASAGFAAGVMPDYFYAIIVAVSAVTTLLTPWLIRFAEPVAAAVDRNLPRPLQTFVTLHGTWIESLTQRPETSAERARMRRTLQVLAIDALVIAALAIATAELGHGAAALLAARTGLAPGRAQEAVVGAAALLALPFLTGIFRTSRALGQQLSRRAFADPVPGRLDLAAAPRRGMIVAVQLTTVLVVGAPLVAVTQPFLPPFTGLGLLAASLLALLVALWRSVSNLHGHVRAAAEVIVDALGRRARLRGPEGSERALERAYKLLPGLGEPVPVRLVDGDAAVGRELSDLEIRGRTAATIIAISRGEDVVLVPDGHERLQAGDVLALAGTTEAIEAARTLLAHGAEPADGPAG